MTRTVPDALGILTADGPGAQVRFTRVYPVPPDDLWSAVTRPDRLARWLGRLSGDLRPGGTFRLDMADDDARDPGSDRATGEVLACDAPTRLHVSWRFPGELPSEVEVVVTGHDEGSLLTLEHRRLSRAAARGYGAGWHTFLDHLGVVLAGGPDTWTDRFLELVPDYRRLLPALGPVHVEPGSGVLATADAPATSDFLVQWLGWTVADDSTVAVRGARSAGIEDGVAPALRLVVTGPPPARSAEPDARPAVTAPDGVPVLEWADVDGLRDALVSARGCGADLDGADPGTVGAEGIALVVPGGAVLLVRAGRGSAPTPHAT